jgi:hypothetical protein
VVGRSGVARRTRLGSVGGKKKSPAKLRKHGRRGEVRRPFAPGPCTSLFRRDPGRDIFAYSLIGRRPPMRLSDILQVKGSHVVTVAPERTVLEATHVLMEHGIGAVVVVEAMTVHRVRHLPILREGALVGIVSIGDVVNALRKEFEVENRQLKAYISGGG